MKLDKETHEALMNACLDDSTKVIRYLEEQQEKQKPYSLAMLIFTVISATGAVIAAITGIITVLQ